MHWASLNSKQCAPDPSVNIVLALSLTCVTKVDLPPLTGPINNKIRFRTSNLFAAGWKYSSTIAQVIPRGQIIDF